MITMSDIAAKAGVSRSTVSFVLNGRHDGVRIPDDTRQRVLEAASELGYRRNELARAMVTGKNRVIGFMTVDPGLDLEFKSRVLAGVLEEASNSGYAVKVVYLPEHDMDAEAIQRCAEWRLAGLITVSLSPSLSEAVLEELGPHTTEISTINNVEPLPQGLNVTSDDEMGVRQAISHLVELGHRRIGFLGADPVDVTAAWREKMFRQVMVEMNLNIAPNHIAYGDWWEVEPNQRAAQQLLEQEKSPTAILCNGDASALVVINVARALGIQVPRDVSVVGFGDYSLGLFSSPPLTTVAQPLRDLGRTVVRNLLERIETSKASAKAPHQILPTQLVVRGSTARL